MTSPIAAFVQLPGDTVNTGKKRRTQTRVVGADTVHEDFVIPTSKRNIFGNYRASLGLVAIPAAAQNGIATGYSWIYNPIGNTKTIAIEKIHTSVNFNALGIDSLCGYYVVDKFTYTGTGSGAARTAVPLDSNYPAASINIRSAMTGLTVSLIATILSRLLPVMGLATGGGGSFSSDDITWEADSEEDEIILRPGEGIVLYNASAVTTSIRALTGDVLWSEFD